MTAIEPGEARILDRGYRRYDGERSGVRGAMRSVTWASAQGALGIRRSVWAKILPVLTVAIAYVPAIVFIGIVALSHRDVVTRAQEPFAQSSNELTVLPTYGQYYGFVIAALVLFVAFVAPELLCPDRRSGLLGMYLASPLDRDTYLISKAAAIFGVLSLVTLGPPLLMLIAFVLQGSGPSGVGDTFLTLGRVLLAGFGLAAFYTAISLAISSFTDRRAVASAGIILTILLSSAVVGGLTESGTASRQALAFSLMALPQAFARTVHGEALDFDWRGLSAATVWIAWAAWTLLGAFITRWNYRRMQVVR